MSSLQVLELTAGHNPNGEAIIEKIPVRVLDHKGIDQLCAEDKAKLGQFELVKSPAFIKGLASGDCINYLSEERDFQLVKRSGNLSIRVFCRGDIANLSDALSPQLEKLGAEHDTETERMLVFSAHVSLGFSAIEQILNDHIGEESDSIWMYGNVYKDDGQTPLNWWQGVLNE